MIFSKRLAAILAMLFGTPACADSIPAATGYINIGSLGSPGGFFSGVLPGPSLQLTSITTRGFATGFVGLGLQTPATSPDSPSLATPFGDFISTSPLVLAMDHAVSGGCGIFSCASAEAALNYYVMVKGPLDTPLSTVPIYINAKLGAQLGYPPGSSTPSAYQGAQASLSIHGAGLMLDASVCASGTSTIGLGCKEHYGDYKFISGVYLSPVNSLITVALRAASAEYGDSTEGAFADPTFTLDPAFLAQGYSLEFSPGIVNDVSPVPGPIVGAGLPGLLMAFGGLVGWRRRRNHAP